MNILGIDIGTKRIGVAIWQDAAPIIRPIELIEVRKPIDAFHRIKTIVDDNSVSHVIIGYPLQPNGQVGILGKLAERWAAKLSQELTCTTVLWDERMTTKQAQRDLNDANVHGKRIKELIDMAAAMKILESWLLAQSKLPTS